MGDSRGGGGRASVEAGCDRGVRGEEGTERGGERRAVNVAQ